jgi:hypothetical protein
MKEDKDLKCPKGVQSSEGHYDPAGPGGGKCEKNLPLCAGCGLPWGRHEYEEKDG